MKCVICNKEFESRRKDARYCSAKCRVKSSRTSNVTDKLSVTDNSVTDNVSVTDNEPGVTDKSSIEDKYDDTDDDKLTLVPGGITLKSYLEYFGGNVV